MSACTEAGDTGITFSSSDMTNRLMTEARSRVEERTGRIEKRLPPRGIICCHDVRQCGGHGYIVLYSVTSAVAATYCGVQIPFSGREFHELPT